MLHEKVVDLTSNLTFTHDYTNVDIPATVHSNTAYVGFTGGTSGRRSTQDILSWTYTNGNGNLINQSDFANHNNFTANGFATFTTENLAGPPNDTVHTSSYPVARLTETEPADLGGSIFYNQQVDVRNFTTTFTFRMLQGTVPLGDGMTFTIQDAQGHPFLPDYGNSVIKLSPNANATSPANRMTVSDFFTPSNFDVLQYNVDVSSGGVVLLPPAPGTCAPERGGGLGQGGAIYLLDASNLGGIGNPIQTIPLPFPGTWGNPAYYNGMVYVQTADNRMKAFELKRDTTDNTMKLTPAPVSVAPNFVNYPNMTPAVSSNDNSNGIVWGVQTDNYIYGGPAVLYAYDANNLNNVLFTSGKLPGGSANQANTASPATKFVTPIIANGKVYFGANGAVDVYGLLNQGSGGNNGGGQTGQLSQAIDQAFQTAITDINLAFQAYTGGSTQTLVNSIDQALQNLSSSVNTALSGVSGQSQALSYIQNVISNDKQLLDQLAGNLSTAQSNANAALEVALQVLSSAQNQAMEYVGAAGNGGNPAIPTGPVESQPEPIKPGKAQVSGQLLGDVLNRTNREAFANAYYTAFANHAASTSQQDLATLFNNIAFVELKDHFHSDASIAGLFGSEKANLKSAIVHMTQEAGLYKVYAQEAKSVGDTAIARVFRVNRQNALYAVNLLQSLQAQRNGQSSTPPSGGLTSPPNVTPGNLKDATISNLLKAMHGDAYTHALFSGFAQLANQNNDSDLASAFTKLANAAMTSFENEAQLSGFVSTNTINTSYAIGEEAVAFSQYQAFGKIAQQKNQSSVAQTLFSNGMDELHHLNLDQQALTALLSQSGSTGTVGLGGMNLGSNPQAQAVGKAFDATSGAIQLAFQSYQGGSTDSLVASINQSLDDLSSKVNTALGGDSSQKQALSDIQSVIRNERAQLGQLAQNLPTDQSAIRNFDLTLARQFLGDDKLQAVKQIAAARIGNGVINTGPTENVTEPINPGLRRSPASSSATRSPGPRTRPSPGPSTPPSASTRPTPVSPGWRRCSTTSPTSSSTTTSVATPTSPASSAKPTRPTSSPPSSTRPRSSASTRCTRRRRGWPATRRSPRSSRPRCKTLRASSTHSRQPWRT